MKARSDNDLANKGKIGQWSNQSRQDQLVIQIMIQITKAIILNARIVHHLLPGIELFDY